MALAAPEMALTSAATRLEKFAVVPRFQRLSVGLRCTIARVQNLTF